MRQKLIAILALCKDKLLRAANFGQHSAKRALQRFLINDEALSEVRGVVRGLGSTGTAIGAYLGFTSGVQHWLIAGIWFLAMTYLAQMLAKRRDMVKKLRDSQSRRRNASLVVAKLLPYLGKAKG